MVMGPGTQILFSRGSSALFDHRDRTTEAVNCDQKQPRRARRWKLDNGNCRSGYVWRERFDGDTTCVPPAERYQLANGYCRNGYVWRESNPSDHVCVTPAQRTQQKTGQPAGPLPSCAGLPLNPITHAPIIPCQ
jgi:hypothetical protein